MHNEGRRGCGGSVIHDRIKGTAMTIVDYGYDDVIMIRMTMKNSVVLVFNEINYTATMRCEWSV